MHDPGVDEREAGALAEPPGPVDDDARTEQTEGGEASGTFPASAGMAASAR